MELSLTVIAVVIGSFILLKIAKKITSKVLGVVVVAGLALGFMYHKGLGPFKQNLADMNRLQEKYCGPEGDQDICDCILKPAQDDISTRFSASEQDSLAIQKIRAAYVLQKSLKATKESAIVCLASRGATAKYKTFLQDFVPIENKYLDIIGEKAKDLKGALQNEVNSLQEEKKDIDEKY